MVTMTVTQTRARTRAQTKARTPSTTTPTTKPKSSGRTLNSLKKADHVAVLLPTATTLTFPSPFRAVFKSRVEKRQSGSEATLQSARATRGRSYVKFGSIDGRTNSSSSGGLSGSSGSSKNTSTGTSDQSRSSQDSGRKSSSSTAGAPSPVSAQVSKADSKRRFLVSKQSSDDSNTDGRGKVRRKPNQLNLDLGRVERTLSNAYAVRYSPASANVSPRNNTVQQGSRPAPSEEVLAALPSGIDFSNLPFTSTSLPAPRRRSRDADRPSPKSLREARLRSLSLNQTLQTIDAEVDEGESAAQRDHHCVPHITSHYEAPHVLHNVNISSENVGVFDTPCGPSQPNSPGVPVSKQKAKRLPNVHVRLASMSNADMWQLARRGFVVDILPSVAVRQLPMNRRTRTLLERYLSRGLSRSRVGFGPYTVRLSNGSSGWNQWAYISRLSIADVGRDGRRRSNSIAGLAGGSDERHDVVIVPLSEAAAEGLRSTLMENGREQARQVLRRRSLGSRMNGS